MHVNVGVDAYETPWCGCINGATKVKSGLSGTIANPNGNVVRMYNRSPSFRHCLTGTEFYKDVEPRVFQPGYISQEMAFYCG